MALCPLLNVGVSVQVFERCVPIATVFVMYLLFLFCLLRQGLRALGFVPAVERRRLLRWLRLVVMYVLVFLLCKVFLREQLCSVFRYFLLRQGSQGLWLCGRW